MGEEVEDERGDIGEDKVRFGIHVIEVGFKLLEVLINKPHAMMLRDLAQRYELGDFTLQMGLARLVRVDGMKLANRIDQTA